MALPLLLNSNVDQAGSTINTDRLVRPVRILTWLVKCVTRGPNIY